MQRRWRRAGVCEPFSPRSNICGGQRRAPGANVNIPQSPVALCACGDAGVTYSLVIRQLNRRRTRGDSGVPMPSRGNRHGSRRGTEGSMTQPDDRTISPRITRFLREIEGPNAGDKPASNHVEQTRGKESARPDESAARPMLIAAAAVIGAAVVIVAAWQVLAIDGMADATITARAFSGIANFPSQTSTPALNHQAPPERRE